MEAIKLVLEYTHDESSNFQEMRKAFLLKILNRLREFLKAFYYGNIFYRYQENLIWEKKYSKLTLLNWKSL